ncbi:MAG: AI-2E family transporter [Rhodobacteraceae bacterium]|nr:MAG: AI-2E family transporter [Paracoccaceae bacterium]
MSERTNHDTTPPEPGPPTHKGGRYGSLAFWHNLLVVLLVVLLGLHYGAGFLVPLAMALMIFVLLTAVIDRIARMRPGGLRIPRWVAQLLGLMLVVMGLGVIAAILSSQAQDVVAAIPRYQARFAQIISKLVQFAGENITAQATAAMAKLDLSKVLGPVVGGAGSFLSSIVLVLLYIPFMMAERGPMRAKIALAASSPGAAQEFSRVLRSITKGLRRYVGIKTAVSLLTGSLSYAVMKPIGLDFAETWAVLAFALNFIPTIGSAIAVLIPAVVALVQFDTMTPFLIILLGCGAIQFVVGNILEPSIAGKSLNLSPLMVILALTFWTTVWGIPGALLSVPITVCVLIILSHLPETRPLAILISGDGRLPEPEPALPLAPAGQPSTEGPKTQRDKI